MEKKAKTDPFAVELENARRELQKIEAEDPAANQRRKISQIEGKIRAQRIKELKKKLQAAKRGIEIVNEEHQKLMRENKGLLERYNETQQKLLGKWGKVEAAVAVESKLRGEIKAFEGEVI